MSSEVEERQQSFQGGSCRSRLAMEVQMRLGKVARLAVSVFCTYHGYSHDGVGQQTNNIFHIVLMEF